MDRKPLTSRDRWPGLAAVPRRAAAVLAGSAFLIILYALSPAGSLPAGTAVVLLLPVLAGAFLYLVPRPGSPGSDTPPAGCARGPASEPALEIAPAPAGAPPPSPGSGHDPDWERTFDAVPDLMAILGRDHRIRRVNRAMADRFGLQPQEMVGQRCFAFMHRSAHPVAGCPLARTLADGQSHTEEIYEPSLDSYFQVNVVPLVDERGDIDGAVHIARDITAGRRAAQALRENEERYRILFEQADVMLFLYHLDQEGRPEPFSEVNEAACRILGHSREEMRRLTMPELCERRENENPCSLLHNFTGRRPQQVTLMLIAGNSMRVLVEASASLFELAGRPTVLAAARDVTERKVLELELQQYRNRLENLVQEKTAALVAMNEALRKEVEERTEVGKVLRESEHRLRQLLEEFNGLLEAIPDTLVLLSPGLEVLWTNRAPGSGVRPDRQPSPLPCFQVWGDHTRPCSDCPTQRSFASGRPDSCQLSTGDGRTWEVRAFPIKNSEGEAVKVIETVTEITEKITLQAEAVRAAHLASIGELAAGVAHEINNPINGIINYAQLIANRIDKESREHDIARRIIKEGDRIAVIVRSLLSFARARKEEKKPVHLREILLDTLTLTDAQLRRDFIRLETRLPRQPLILYANGSQLEQVFLNLINNARYALNQKYPEPHDDKRLEITGEAVTIGGREHVRIVFHDQGTGIAEAIRDKVMNPFFSDKPGEKGTGLGLSISHGIVSDHEGRITIDSVEGEYTRFIIDLPAGEGGG